MFQMLEEVASKHDTGEISAKEGINEMCEEQCGKVDDEVLEMYNVEETKKDVYSGRRGDDC